MPGQPEGDAEHGGGTALPAGLGCRALGKRLEQRLGETKGLVSWYMYVHVRFWGLKLPLCG